MKTRGGTRIMMSILIYNKPPMSSADYYEVLGLSKDSATKEGINIAFRKKALTWHPDRNKDNKELAKDKFEAICEAFEVLSDEKRKSIYDQYGEQGLKNGVPGASSPFYFHPSSPEEIFSQFFGTKSPFDTVLTKMSSSLLAGAKEIEKDEFAKFFGTRINRGPKQPPEVIKTVSCTLEELYKGVKNYSFTFNRRELAPDGVNTVIRERTLRFDIPPGLRGGTKLRYEKEGDQGQGIIAPDIVLELGEKPHNRFQREGDHLIYTAKIKLVEALTGSLLHIKTLDDRRLRIPVPEIVTPKYVKVITGEGMPKAQNFNEKGDLRIKFDIVFPDKLNDNQKDVLLSVLP